MATTKKPSNASKKAAKRAKSAFLKAGVVPIQKSDVEALDRCWTRALMTPERSAHALRRPSSSSAGGVFEAAYQRARAAKAVQDHMHAEAATTRDPDALADCAAHAKRAGDDFDVAARECAAAESGVRVECFLVEDLRAALAEAAAARAHLARLEALANDPYYPHDFEYQSDLTKAARAVLACAALEDEISEVLDSIRGRMVAAAHRTD